MCRLQYYGGGTFYYARGGNVAEGWHRIDEKPVVIRKFVDQQTIDDFARVSGDVNPVHTDPHSPLSKKVRDGLGIEGTIAHGAYCADALASDVLYGIGGPTCIFGEKGPIRFLKPVPVDSWVRLSGQIKAVEFCRRPEKADKWKYTVEITYYNETTAEEYNTRSEAVIFVFA